jgi:hypothetical protein
MKKLWRRSALLSVLPALVLSACGGAASVTPPLLASPTAQVSATPALPPATLVPVPVTVGVQPTPSTPVSPTTAPTAVLPTSTPTPLPLPRISLGTHGINVADYADANLAALNGLGFGWIQVFNPPEFPIGNYKILYRVPLGASISGQLSDIDSWGDGLESLARERQGVIAAYSIGNEVNLSREWGGQQPDPVLYTRLLAVAYARIKSADPDALVISAGLAPTGGDGPGFVDDLAYARAMFDNGALAVMDAFGFHPYGFAYEPERDPAQAEARGLLFRRAEAHHQQMTAYGAGDKQLWATEFGWLRDAAEEGQTCDFGTLNWQRVPGRQQADYTVRAFDYAAKNWPWVGPMFLWNYDFSRSPLYPEACEQMKWFSLVDAGGQPRPVLETLRQQTKN